MEHHCVSRGPSGIVERKKEEEGGEIRITVRSSNSIWYIAKRSEIGVFVPPYSQNHYSQ